MSTIEAPAMLLRTTLADTPEDILQPPAELRDAARDAVKYFLDPVARAHAPVFKRTGVTVNGFDASQVWEQTRLILDAVAERVLFADDSESGGEDDEDDEEASGEDEEDELERIAKRRKLTEDASDEEQRDERTMSVEEDYSGSDMDVDEDEDMEEGLEADGESVSEAEEDVEDDDQEDLESASDGIGEDDDEEVDEEDDEADNTSAPFVKDVNGLNDGFFDIDQFNRQTEDAERAFNDDDGSDSDDEIDYFADPDEMSASLDKSKPAVKRAEVDDEDEDEDSDDYDENDLEGHFGGANGREADGDDIANDIKYEDFFAPPAKRRQKFRQQKKPKEPAYSGLGADSDEDVYEAMSGLKKDLFADDVGDDGKGGDEAGMSGYERMQRKLQEKIAQLEEENVTRKNWTLMGEARASMRPQNSLLEETVEFETGAKPVPVITSEVTTTLEDMIRTRIKNQEFDDVARRTPESTPQFRASRLVEIEQTKSTKSLSELYEEEHVRAAADAEGGEAPPTAQDAKLGAAHTEIETLFADISYKLDALSSWHFRPKPANAAGIAIVANTAAIAMEDAQPTSEASQSRLAPQELYVPLAEESTGAATEVLGADGMPVARAEQSRDERKRQRRRMKARHARAAEKRAAKRAAAPANSRAGVMETLRRGNVTVIGKQGEKRDVEGRVVKSARAARGPGLKL
ncbi:U3 small nucleolar ribonucleoprotein complex, subunit Mpp10 [Limtongia smithiae]|uniref:U3 small nucleolar ribonucleoprotein complex, subunit Mpp10 n=1 Tax=Limtongia smithiae TaxID=1125753 RepID=UPI0034CF4E4C